MDYFKGDELAAKVWMEKYALKNNQNQFLEQNPDAMHKRLARAFAAAEKRHEHPKNNRLKKLSDYGKSRKRLNEKESMNILKTLTISYLRET